MAALLAVPATAIVWQQLTCCNYRYNHSYDGCTRVLLQESLFQDLDETVVLVLSNWIMNPTVDK